MAEQEFFTAAFFAFIGWFVAGAMAAFRSSSLMTGSSKAVCWIVPVAGLFLLLYLIYDGLYGEAGGFRTIALGLVAAVFWILALVLPIAQLLFGFFAKVTDRPDR